jgi:hypothetical protein
MKRTLILVFFNLSVGSFFSTLLLSGRRSIIRVVIAIVIAAIGNYDVHNNR